MKPAVADDGVRLSRTTLALLVSCGPLPRRRAKRKRARAASTGADLRGLCERLSERFGRGR